MTTIPHILKRNATVIMVTLLLLSMAFSLTLPLFASAQTTPAAGGTATETPQPSVCDGGWFSKATITPICYTGPIAAAISTALIYIASWVLIVAGSLFDLLVDHTIIRFGDTLYGANIKAAVETAWAAFRDISNIVIIGMFVFVAISTILGSDTFGYKKWVAKVIVIAVLINFSLLFTKVIIDFSNFTAMQFYKAAALQTTTPSTAGPSAPATNAQKGIAGAFLNYMGVGGYGASFTAVRRVAEANNSFWIGLLHGVVSAIFLLAAAIVLLYGSFLLASRALLLIFLILTSSIAFATYLIPTIGTGKFGWSAWWSSLLKSAVFAPLLMVFLWVTLAVAQALKVKTGTLGDLMSNPTNGANMDALFAYIIVLGLLFISFKIAASFSTGIGGFNYAAMLPAGIAGAGAQLLGFAGRQTFGRMGENVGAALQKRSTNTRSETGKMLYDFAAKPFKYTAKQDFNALRTPVLGNTLAKTVGAKLDTLAGKKIGGFQGTKENLAKNMNAYKERTENSPELKKQLREEAAQAASSAVQSGAAQKKITDQEYMAELAKNKPAENQHKEADKEIKLSKESVDAITANTVAAHKEFANTMQGLKNEKGNLEMKKSDETSKARIKEIEKEMRAAQSEHVEKLKESNGRIRQAEERAHSATKLQAQIRAETENRMAESKVSAIKNPKSKEEKAIVAKIEESNRDLKPLLGKITGWTEAETNRFHELRGKVSKSEKEKKQAKLIAEQINDNNKHGAAPTQSAPPPSGGTAGGAAH